MSLIYPLRSIVILVLSLGIQGSHTKSKSLVLTNRDVGKVNENMTDLTIHVVTNPLLDARFFANACLARYDVVSEIDRAFKSMHGVLNDYRLINKPRQMAG